MRKYSSIVLRIGISLVMLWFGLQQGQNPAPWVTYLPEWTKSLPISQITFVYLNSWFELVTGILLLTGFYTRIIAFFLALHLFGIVFSVGYNATGMRDFGLSVALFSIFLHGQSDWSLDEFFERKMKSFRENYESERQA